MVSQLFSSPLEYIRSTFSKKPPIDDDKPSSFILRSRSFRNDNERRIYLGMSLPDHLLDSDGQPKTNFKPNKIKTTKYTFYNFIAKNLFEQFRRVANLYFLGMAILQLIPIFGVTNVVFVVLPLLTVILITMVKDGFEDWKRSQADNKFNSTMTHVLANIHNYNHKNTQSKRYLGFLPPNFSFNNLIFGSISPPLVSSEIYQPNFEPCLWQDVKVGDIICIEKDEPVPADVLILSTSDPDGECYVETKNLDGETNLKARSAVTETMHLKDAADCSQLQAHIDVGSPTSNLYALNGSLSMVEHGERNYTTGTSRTNSMMDLEVRLSNLPSTPIPFSIKNVLLRGCVVKNTRFVVGVVMFTGADTKIILNSSPTPSKRSKIEKMMNFQVAISFVILVVLGLVIAIGYGVTCNRWVGTPVALLFGTPEDVFNSAFINFWASLILLQNVIPVSLYVSIEFVKSWQAYFIFSDINMYYEPTDAVTIPKSWNLSDDLGQIEYIFSDKTGTLTRNVMEFKKCSIGGKIYGKDLPGQETDVEKGLKHRKNATQEVKEVKTVDAEKIKREFHSAMQDVFQMESCDLDQLPFVDPELYYDIKKEDDHSTQIKDFFTNLALCHTVLLETDLGAEAREKKQLVYRAESPDEKALVAAAKDLGFQFLGRTKATCQVKLLGQSYAFEQLALLEFDSTRKRMSVILRRPAPWNDLILLVKGADNVILERIAKGQDELMETTLKHLKEFSNVGLRTLCLGYRILPEDEFEDWFTQFKAAQSNLVDREGELEKVNALIERDLVLMGATAIEDKLQEHVPEAIEALRKAGIKVWVLTGDKMETAINIGFGCKLLTRDMKIWTVASGSARNVRDNFDHVIQELDQLDDGQHAIVIDGAALKYILDKKSSLDKLLAVAPRFKAVICCRTSPLQKAQVVRLMKKGHKALTLAIGDGANDVSMIQEAHVGVAIAGEEGLQASMVSDYTLAQFRYLQNLLLVHGQNSYHRIAEMTLCFFYKNIIWTFSAFWYQFFCGFSSNLFFTYNLIPLYNMIFTVAPVVILGTMDQRLTYDYYMRFPQVYKLGIKGKFFHNLLFWVYIIDGMWQSLVCFFGFYLLNMDVTSFDGTDSNQYEFSTGVAIVVIVVANLVVGLHTRYWNWWVHFWIYISILFVFGFVAVYSTFDGDFYLVGVRLFVNAPSFWLSVPLLIVAAILPRFVFFYAKVTYKPDDLDLVREIKRIDKLKRDRNRV